MTLLNIEPATAANLDELLGLIEDYQRFYRCEDIDPARNRRYFAGLLEQPDRARQHLGRLDGRAVGFTTLYVTDCSLRAGAVATLYDLYLVPALRGRGLGRQLLLHAADCARAMGLDRMQWETAPDNLRAQRLYDAVGARASDWRQYSLDLSA
jgi:GNAT superfamily N-acetyltransferase